MLAGKTIGKRPHRHAPSGATNVNAFRASDDRETQFRTLQRYDLPRAKKAGILTETGDNIQKLTPPSEEALDATMAQILAVSTVITAIPVAIGRRRVIR